MRIYLLSMLVAASLSRSSFGQHLSASDVELVKAARAKYYNLQAAGFQGLQCSVDFDFKTVPIAPGDDVTFKLLQATRFTLALDEKGRAIVQHHYPDGTEDAIQQSASQFTGLLSSLVMGTFQTWPTKGLTGPIPPFDSQIENIVTTEYGYIFSLHVPGAPVEVSTDKNYLVTKIVSTSAKIEEHPSYAPGSTGLVFVGNHAVDNSESAGPVDVRYEIGTAIIDGLIVPSSVRLRVNQNIDVKFTLNACLVKKGAVVHVEPSANK